MSLVLIKTGTVIGQLIGSNSKELIVKVNKSHIKRIPKSNAAKYAVVKGS